MVFVLPNNAINLEDASKVGLMIHDLNTLSKNSLISIEPSVIITTEVFEEYLDSRIVPEQIVQSCLDCFEKLEITQVDAFISTYNSCYINSTPISATVSYSSIFNTITALFDRWFDSKPRSQRIIQRLAPSFTYPAILFQPHRETELNTITRHPQTGMLLHNGDGEGLVHCSKTSLSDNEEQMIRLVDSEFTSPRKIVYCQETDEKCVIRRILSYPMTAEAKLNHIFEKWEKGLLTNEEAVSLISPEFIAVVDRDCYELSAKNQYSGLAIFYKQKQIGKAVFQWTDKSSITKYSIFLVEEISPEDIDIIKSCGGVIATRGGMTSHCAVACRELGKTCIVNASNLKIDSRNQKVYTDKGEDIFEGDIICILGNKWSINGSVVHDFRHNAVCSVKMIDKLKELILPYADYKVMAGLPIETQIHIASLIRELHKVGIINEHPIA